MTKRRPLSTKDRVERLEKRFAALEKRTAKYIDEIHRLHFLARSEMEDSVDELTNRLTEVEGVSARLGALEEMAKIISATKKPRA